MNIHEVESVRITEKIYPKGSTAFHWHNLILTTRDGKEEEITLFPTEMAKGIEFINDNEPIIGRDFCPTDGGAL